MVCPACGTLCPPNARHCQHCGARLASTLVPASASATAASGSIAPSAPYASGATPAGGGAGTPLPPGTVLNGRYRVLRVLGAGAFGRVYLAEDTQDTGSPQVAIKELLDMQFTSPDDKREAISWFKREVSVMLTLEHVGIPAIYGYWTAHTTTGPFYLAMEYIPGRTLEQTLQDAGGHVPWPQVVEWGSALCDVLAYLHGRTPPYVFRDLKLPNVMVDSRTNGPVLIDFGITRQLAPTGGTAIGTWGYVPYEQILGKAEPRSDLYALGATLHALLTGRHPDAEYTRLLRSGLDLEATLRALFPPADTLVGAVPAALGQVISRATAFAASDRFPNALTMAAALQQVLGPTAPGAPGSAATLAAPMAAQGAPGISPRVTPAAAAPVFPAAPPVVLPIASTAAGPAPDIIVSSAGHGHCVTISAALRNAAPGTRIAVQPGHYPETLIIDKPVEIVGAGPVDDIIVEAVDGPCLIMAADEATVSGLTLDGCARRSNQEYVAVDIPHGRLVLEDCRITSDTLACVAIHGAAAAPTIRRCTIHDGAHAGVFVYDGGQGMVEECDIAGNAMSGVHIFRQGNPLVRRCKIHDSADSGVFVFDDGQGTIDECDIYGNAMAGVAIKEYSDPTIKGCNIHDGRQAGVLVYESGRGTVEECNIYRNASVAVGIAQGGNPLIRRCTIRDGLREGILVHDHGLGTVEDCDIARHAAAGVAIAQAGNPLIRRCMIHDGQGVGVLVDEAGQGTLDGCTISQNILAGVEIRQAGHPRIYRSLINHNGQVGIWAHSRGAGTVEDCDLRHNADGAWRIALWCWVERQGNKE